MKELQYIDEQFESFIAELNQFLKIPSISTDSEFHNDCLNAATWVENQLKSIGLNNVKQYPTQGFPIVYGELISDAEKPTLLLYGHYDVQPSEPNEKWTTPAFEPTIREGKLFARGVADDKGQFFCHLKALQALLKLNASLPINVKVIIEGEEEIGSTHLPEFIQTHTDLLKADAVLVSDTPMYGFKQPSVCFSLRGLLYTQIEVRTAQTDLHSGQHGGAVPNAIQALTELIQSLKTTDGKITIPHFYEGVEPLPQALKEANAGLVFDNDAYQKELGLTCLTGETGFNVLEQRWFRPTLDCNGIWGGYTGEGSKTVIPSLAHAKISMRLVSKQNPNTIFENFSTFLKQKALGKAELNIQCLSMATPVQTPIDTPYIAAAMQALETVWKVKPVLQGEGGTIPVVADFEKYLGIPTVLMGLNYPDDRIHAPDERMHLENIKNGIKTCVVFFQNVGRLAS